MNLFESVNKKLNEADSKGHKINLIKYSADGYVERPEDSWHKEDFKKGTSVLMPFVCGNCDKEYYVKSSIEDFFKQGDFDDPYETPVEMWKCPKCGDKGNQYYNGEPLIKEPGVNTNKNINESNLKEADSVIWSNTGNYDYYQDLSREQMIEELKGNGWDEEETSDGELLINADDETIRDYLMPEDPGSFDYEDYCNSIEPMIEKQCYGGILVLSGIAANWRGSGEACKGIKVDDLENYLMPSYDANIKLYCDEHDNLYYTESNHDTPMGGTRMYLYSFWDETSYRNAEKYMQKDLDDPEFDMYYFSEYVDYQEVADLIKSGLLKNVKRDSHYVGL